jgi:hypothetical protein
MSCSCNTGEYISGVGKRSMDALPSGAKGVYAVHGDCMYPYPETLNAEAEVREGGGMRASALSIVSPGI